MASNAAFGGQDAGPVFLAAALTAPPILSPDSLPPLRLPPHVPPPLPLRRYVACMNPTAGSFTVDPRLQRLFVTLAVETPGSDSLMQVYGTFLHGHLKKFNAGGFVGGQAQLEGGVLVPGGSDGDYAAPQLSKVEHASSLPLTLPLRLCACSPPSLSRPSCLPSCRACRPACPPAVPAVPACLLRLPALPAAPARLPSLPAEVQELGTKILQAALALHERVVAQFRKTAVNFHYEFTVRHLAQVFQGLLMSTPEKYNCGAWRAVGGCLPQQLRPCYLPQTLIVACMHALLPALTDRNLWLRNAMLACPHVVHPAC